MKKIYYVHCAMLMLLFGVSIFGQNSKSELEQLRKELGLNSTISANDALFPSSNQVKIYLAIKHDKRVAKDFVNWVDKWNASKGNQYGRLQIVDDIEDADIAAVQFQFGTKSIVRNESLNMKIGKTSSPNERVDEFVLNRVANSKINAESSVRALQIPIFTYLVVRDANSDWFVNYSRIDELVSNKNPFPEMRLRSAIEDSLKKR